MKLTTNACSGGTLSKYYLERKISPPLQWTQVESAKSYALLVVNLSLNLQIHWMITFIPPDRKELSENVKNRPLQGGMIQQQNSFNVYGFTGFIKDKTYEYLFNIYALSKELKDITIDPNQKLSSFLENIEPYLIDSDFFTCQINPNITNNKRQS